MTINKSISRGVPVSPGRETERKTSMKTMVNLFYETFNPRQKRHHLSMTLKEKPGEHTIRILQNGREVIRATGDEREQAFQMATRDLVRRFPAKGR